MTATVKVEIAFASQPDDATQVWTDVTDYLVTSAGISITRGRSDARASIDPGRLALTLDNADGRFTWGNAAGAYYPNVIPRKRIRVTVLEDDGGTWRRWDGPIDGWPVSYVQGDAALAQVTITATDRLDRLTRARLLRDALAEELGTAAYSTSQWILDDPTFSVLGSTTVLSGGLQWLYGMQESSGSTTAGDVSGALGRPTLTATQVGTGGTCEFGTAGIMPEGTAVKFAPASVGNGLVLTKSTGPVSYVGGEFSVWCQFAWSGSTGATLVQVGASPYTRVTFAVTPTTVTATLTPPTGSPATLTKSVATGDDRPHWMCLSVQSGNASLYVDTSTTPATGTLPVSMGNAQGVTIGGTTSVDPHQVGWVGFSSSITTAARSADLGLLATGGAEPSGSRIARILRWLGIATADTWIMAGQSQIAYQATGGATALDLVNAVNDVEGGRFFATADGRYIFQDRSYQQTFFGSPFVLPLDPSSVDPDNFGVVVDTAGMVNDLQVSRPAGATFRLRDEASITAYGQMSNALTLYAASDEALRDAGSELLARYATPAPRIPTIRLDLVTEDWIFTRQLALFTELGAMVQVSGLPAATTPGGTPTVVVEGIVEQITPTSHTLEFSTSPTRPTYWVLGDAALSVLGSTTVLGR